VLDRISARVTFCSRTQYTQTRTEAIKTADALLITAGAGMGVDSGLPDFRGTQEFWRAYQRIGGTLIRINLREVEAPAGQIGLPFGAAEDIPLAVPQIHHGPMREPSLWIHPHV